MMEKTANYEYSIYRDASKVLMRCPGGEIVNYDGRFGDYTKDFVVAVQKEYTVEI